MKSDNSTQTVQRLLTKDLDPIRHSRIGRIVSLDLENDAIWVDYEGNPFQKPVIAKLAVYSATYEDLQQALEKSYEVRLEFEDLHPQKPVIKEIYISLAALKGVAETSSEKEQLHVKAYDIILEAENRIIIKSGDAQTVYRAEGGELVSEATRIDSSATLTHRIKGGAVTVN